MEQQMSWFEEKTPTQTTVKEVDTLCELYFVAREQIEEKKAALKEDEENLKKVEAKIIEFLNEYGKSSWKTDRGTLTRVERWSVTTPKSPEDKQAFFEYLKERGVYDDMISVNSRTLQAFYREEQEQAVRSGKVATELDFKIPGIDEPKMVQTLSRRRA